MQVIGMQKHHSHCIPVSEYIWFFCFFCVFFYLFYTGINVERSKHTASEDEVVLQATREAHTGSNKKHLKCLEKQKPKAGLWDLTAQATGREEHLLRCCFRWCLLQVLPGCRWIFCFFLSLGFDRWLKRQFQQIWGNFSSDDHFL